MSPEFQEVFNLNKGSIPVRLNMNMDKFDDCAKLSAKDFVDTAKSGGLVPSVSQGCGAQACPDRRPERCRQPVLERRQNGARNGNEEHGEGGGYQVRRVSQEWPGLQASFCGPFCRRFLRAPAKGWIACRRLMSPALRLPPLTSLWHANQPLLLEMLVRFREPKTLADRVGWVPCKARSSGEAEGRRTRAQQSIRPARSCTEVAYAFHHRVRVRVSRRRNVYEII